MTSYSYEGTMVGETFESEVEDNLIEPLPHRNQMSLAHKIHQAKRLPFGFNIPVNSDEEELHPSVTITKHVKKIEEDNGEEFSIVCVGNLRGLYGLFVKEKNPVGVLPEANLYLICGNMTSDGSLESAKDAREFIYSIPADGILIIPGPQDYFCKDWNQSQMDGFFEAQNIMFTKFGSQKIGNLNIAMNCYFEGDCRSSPYAMDHEEVMDMWQKIPTKVDIILCNTMPFSVMDVSRRLVQNVPEEFHTGDSVLLDVMRLGLISNGAARGVKKLDEFDTSERIYSRLKMIVGSCGTEQFGITKCSLYCNNYEKIHGVYVCNCNLFSGRIPNVTLRQPYMIEWKFEQTSSKSKKGEESSSSPGPSSSSSLKPVTKISGTPKKISVPFS